jgi:hypothetical protein
MNKTYLGFLSIMFFILTSLFLTCQDDKYLTKSELHTPVKVAEKKTYSLTKSVEKFELNEPKLEEHFRYDGKELLNIINRFLAVHISL